MTKTEREIADLLEEAKRRQRAVDKPDREAWARLGVVIALLLLLSLIAIGVSGCGDVTLGPPLVAPDAGAIETVREVAADAISKSPAPDASMDAGGTGDAGIGGERDGGDSAAGEVAASPRSCSEPYPNGVVDELRVTACPTSAVITCTYVTKTGGDWGPAVDCTTEAGTLCVRACP